MSDGPIGFIIIGVLMMALSWPVTLLHMKMVRWYQTNIFKRNPEERKTFLKWYKVFFFVTWTGMGLFITIFHTLRLLGVVAD